MGVSFIDVMQLPDNSLNAYKATNLTAANPSS